MALKHRTYPTGMVIWPVPGSDRMSIIWPGPGIGLLLGMDADKPGGSMTPIEHPTASGTYQTRKQATKAAEAFIAATDSE